MAAIDPQTLLEEAKCYACFAQASLAEMIKLALLSRIASNGGGGGSGGGSVTSGVGPPVAAPASSPAIYFDESDGTQYNYYAGAWH